MVMIQLLTCHDIIPPACRLQAENALAEPMPDMRFSLPASPSAPVLLLLTAACAEVRRVGDHRLGR